MVIFTDDIWRHLDQGRSVLLFLLDLSPEFDMVDYDLMFYCLTDVGVQGTELAMSFFPFSMVGNKGWHLGTGSHCDTYLNVEHHREQSCHPCWSVGSGWVAINMQMIPGSICCWMGAWISPLSLWKGIWRPWLNGCNRTG